MAACGYGWEARPPAPARLARVRAMPAARLFLSSHALVVYLTSPAARSVVARAAQRFPAEQAARIAVRDLPAASAGSYTPTRNQGPLAEARAFRCLNPADPLPAT